MNRLDHFSFGARALADARALYVDVLGGTPVDGGPGPGYDGGQWSYARGERLEVIVPDGSGTGFLERFLAARGPRVHHATFVVPNLGAACDRAAAEGYEIVGRSEQFPWWKEAFLHPKQSLGIVIQLAETNPSLGGGAWTLDWDGFKVVGGTPARPPAEIRCLVMRAPDESEAARLFERTLGGRRVAGEDARIEYTWIESPMRIALDFESGPPGPVRIEVACARELGLSADVLAPLGASVVQVG